MSNPRQSSERPTASSAERCYCAAGEVIDLLSRRHAIRVVCVVGTLQPVQYSAIEDALGTVSSSTLSTRLRELTDAGLLDREQYGTIPPRVEYELTADGEELRTLLDPLVEWAESRDGEAG